MVKMQQDSNWGFDSLIRQGVYVDRAQIEEDIGKILDYAESNAGFTVGEIAALLGIDTMGAALLCTGLGMDKELHVGIRQIDGNMTRVFSLSE